ncbi:hypothetical protein GE061_008361 [Apolygus lucorum]|uniref:Uncharacterized protein n=1 Tax=Apolygus lucorum TaxID=248454 RepID=A0A6A4IYG0_APOLU|nr:hypothetical protein GE061_008361 [Apolygus lucorum]
MMSPTGCDTFVVLNSNTSGGVIFGKNSDRPAGEPQEIVHCPAANNDGSSKLKCTYIEIDQVENTLEVILSKPTWMWGAEMGANSEGVAIGNEAVWTKVPDLESKALIGMDLVRLGLERGKTAEAALDVIIELLEKHGQGGPCSEDGNLTYHNSFLIADSKEAWVLETAGKLWVAQRFTDGFRNISNCLSITTGADRVADGLKQYAIDNNLWNGEGELDWTAVFADGCPRGRFNQGRDLLCRLSADKSFDVTSMMKVLRDEDSGICMKLDSPGSITASSQVSLLYSDRPCAHWFTGTPDPSVSVFKPFVFTPGVKISHHTVAQAGEREHNLYKLHKNAVKSKPSVLTQLRAMEDISVTETTNFISNFTPESSLSELDELFKDVVETEVKFYK